MKDGGGSTVDREDAQVLVDGSGRRRYSRAFEATEAAAVNLSVYMNATTWTIDIKDIDA